MRVNLLLLEWEYGSVAEHMHACVIFSTHSHNAQLSFFNNYRRNNHRSAIKFKMCIHRTHIDHIPNPEEGSHLSG